MPWTRLPVFLTIQLAISAVAVSFGRARRCIYETTYLLSPLLVLHCRGRSGENFFSGATFVIVGVFFTYSETVEVLSKLR